MNLTAASKLAFSFSLGGKYAVRFGPSHICKRLLTFNNAVSWITADSVSQWHMVPQGIGAVYAALSRILILLKLDTFCNANVKYQKEQNDFTLRLVLEAL